MTEPIWKIVGKAADGLTDVVSRTWPDGKQESCLVTTPEYLAWIALGNTPLPADEVNHGTN
jgi:hypothetical protein